MHDDDFAGGPSFDARDAGLEVLAVEGDAFDSEGGDFGGAACDEEGHEPGSAVAHAGEVVGDGGGHLAELLGGGGLDGSSAASDAIFVCLERLERLTGSDGGLLRDLDSVLATGGDGDPGNPSVDGCYREWSMVNS
ncbi:hypothetical protein ACWD7F_38305 [Streptomyces sp. NPDC005122]